jgi:hypothetical protein
VQGAQGGVELKIDLKKRIAYMGGLVLSKTIID